MPKIKRCPVSNTPHNINPQRPSRETDVWVAKTESGKQVSCGFKLICKEQKATWVLHLLPTTRYIWPPQPRSLSTQLSVLLSSDNLTLFGVLLQHLGCPRRLKICLIRYCLQCRTTARKHNVSIGVETAGPSASRPESGSGAATDRVQGSGEGHRNRGRNPADKESKRLKRYSLLAFTLLPLLLPLTPVVPIKYKTYLTFL